MEIRSLNFKHYKNYDNVLSVIINDFKICDGKDNITKFRRHYKIECQKEEY